MINFRYATISDLDFLVELRIRDLKMFSNQNINQDTINNIKKFYQNGIKNQTCFTLLGFDNDNFVVSGTLYLYNIMPSNENPLGRVGQLTNIWVKEEYRHQGIATKVVKELIALKKDECGMVCLNSSHEAKSLYQKIGFKTKENYMVMML